MGKVEAAYAWTNRRLGSTAPGYRIIRTLRPVSSRVIARIILRLFRIIHFVPCRLIFRFPSTLARLMSVTRFEWVAVLISCRNAVGNGWEIIGKWVLRHPIFGGDSRATARNVHRAAGR